MASAVPPIDISPLPARIQPSSLPEGWQHGALTEIFVRGIWLVPITASADRHHGYATTDFRAIEPQYGTLADFDEPIAQAHRRVIGVIGVAPALRGS